MLKNLEKGVGFRKGFSEIPARINGDNVSTGIVAGIFNIGTLLLITKILQDAHLPDAVILSWILVVFTGGGLLSLLMSLYYQKPIGGAWSIAGLVLVGGALPYYPLPQVIGGFLMAGFLVAMLGFSGIISQIVRWLPRPVMMAMIAGILLRFGVGIITSLEQAPLLAGITFLVFLCSQRFFPRFPAVLTALIAGALLALLSQDVAWTPIAFSVAAPVLHRPVFVVRALVGISLPLALTVIGAENMQAMGILMTEGYDNHPPGTRVPINGMTAVSGVGMMIVSFFGGHSINMAGVLTAICSSSSAGKDLDSRYVASLIAGVITILFGLFGKTLLAIMGVFPEALINLIAGLAMMGGLIASFRGAFSGVFSYGAFFAFITAVSGVRFMGIGAPFWALVMGLTTSLLLDSKDW